MTGAVSFPHLATKDGEVVADHHLKKSGNGGDNDGPPPSERKLAAKRYNEGVKLIATAFNNFAVAVIVTALLQPMIADAAKFVIEYRPIWYFVGVGLHIVAQVILRYEFRSEE